MKVVECTNYGAPSVLQVCERPIPVSAENQILVKVFATTVSSGDWRIRSLSMPPGFGIIARPIFGFSTPRQPILGSEAAGEVVQVGSKVEGFTVGDRVALFDGMKMGCHAEFKAVRADGCIVRLPDKIDFTTAAAIPFGGTTALHFLRRTAVCGGDQVLVIGASGCVGSSVVQLAKYSGASVTAVCSGSNIGMVRNLGADHVIDYKLTSPAAIADRFDVVIETVGALDLNQCMRLVKDGGRVALVASGLRDMIKASFAGKSRKIKAVAGPAEERQKDLQDLIDLADKGMFSPIIDAIFPFSEIAKAHERVESGRKRGSVVIAVA